MPNTIVCLEDSLTAIGGDVVIYTYPTLLSYKFPGTKVSNLGVSGNNTTDMIARMSAMDVLQPSILIIWAGVNDVAENASIASTIANLQTLINHGLSLGSEVWELTVTPEDTNTDSQLEVREGINNWILLSAIGLTRRLDACMIIKDPNNPRVRQPKYADSSIVHLSPLGINTIVTLF